MKRTTFLMLTLTLGFLALGATTVGVLLNNSQTTTHDSQWRLLVTGLVTHPLNLTLEDIAAMPKTTINANLYCVDAPTTVLAGGNWTGVTLAYLLQQTGVAPTAVKVAFYAKDGYTTDLTVQTAMSNDVVVAYQRNGEPLQETLRLAVPGRWGYKWISDITRIELINYDFKGRWESNGYSDEALIP